MTAPIRTVTMGQAMNIHEYQAKALLRSYGAPISDGRVVLRAEEAKTAAGELDGPLWVVKAQIHAGGRGKGKFKEADAGDKGGVRIAKSVEEAATEATPDAGPHAGHPSDRACGQAGQPHLHRGRRRHRDANFTSPCWSTARPAASPSSARPRAAWTSRKSRPRRRKRS